MGFFDSESNSSSVANQGRNTATGNSGATAGISAAGNVRNRTRNTNITRENVRINNNDISAPIITQAFKSIQGVTQDVLGLSEDLVRGSVTLASRDGGAAAEFSRTDASRYEKIGLYALGALVLLGALKMATN